MSGIVEDLTRVSRLLQMPNKIVAFHINRINQPALVGLQEALTILIDTATKESALTDQQLNLLEKHLSGFSTYWASCDDLGVVNGLAFSSAKLTGSPWQERMAELGYPIPTNKLVNVCGLINSAVASSTPDKQ